MSGAEAPKSIKILLVEDNPGDARLLKEYLAESNGLHFELTRVDHLGAALERLEKEHFDIVLLDLMLPDSQGLETFSRVNAQASSVPVVVLSGIVDEAVAIKAVHEGAEDYLVKGAVNANILVRALRYSIERHSMKTALRSQSLIDDLTGLYNHRGFLTLAEQQLKLSRRNKRGFFLVFIDLDGLKLINDYFGHLEGDESLVNTAKILKKTFRETDIIGRIGGDEFMVLAIDASGDSREALVARLQDNVRQYNTHAVRPYAISLSYGIVCFGSDSQLSIEELMERADQELYKHKREKKGSK